MRWLLSGSWTAATPAPTSSGLETAIQLSDGSIMVNGENGGGVATKTWFRLKPNSAGSYTSGAWTALAPMSLERRFFAADVLPSGKVLVLGGEYSGPSSANNDTNTGEIYDPVLNSWSSIAPFPQPQFGDGPSVVLSDGRVLCGYLNGPQTYIYNPTTNVWVNGPNRLNGDRSAEESWVKLPDDSILTYEISGSQPQTAQRFVLGAVDALDQWVSAGSVPVSLATNGGNGSIVPEEGPALLLPDGRAFFVGGTSNTALYTPSTNSWTAGPSIPSGLGAFDAPGAMMPNGHVLFAAGTINGVTFPGPTSIFEYDPVANTITAATGVGVNLNVQPFQTRMLVIPSGQVLLSNSSAVMYAWTPVGAPDASWLPSISNITNDNGSNVFTLSGYRLNGISEGASYGDDAQMATDFPIIRLQDQAGNISFARTFNWTSTSVNSGFSSVNFTVPGGLGAYLVTLIANGIPSPTVLNIQCSGASGENFEMQPNANANYTDLNLIGAGVVATFFIGSFNSLIMTGDAASNTLVVNDNFFGRTSIINGGDGNDFLRVENNGTGATTEYGGNGNDFFDFSFYARNLGNTQGFTYVNGGAGADDIFVYDSNVTSAVTYAIDLAQLNRPGFGGFFYASDIEALSLTPATAVGDVFNITSSYSVTPIFLYGTASGTVNIGSAGSVQGVQGQLFLEDNPSFLTINVDDSADTGLRTVNMGTYTPAGDTPFGYISGLAPANINYEYADTTAINISTGTAVGNTINILEDGASTTLIAHASANVNIGDSNGVQGILGVLNLTNPPSFNNIMINDSGNPGSQTVTFDLATVNGFNSGRVIGLAPAIIEYKLADTTALTVKTSNGGSNILNVQSLAVSTSLIGNSGVFQNDTLNLGNAGSLSGITSPLSVTNPTGFTDIHFDDSVFSSVAGTFTFSSFTPPSDTLWGKVVFPTGSITVGSLSYRGADVSSVSVAMGFNRIANITDIVSPTTLTVPPLGSFTANISGTTGGLAINKGNNADTINIGNAGSVAGINGPITLGVTGTGMHNVSIDDSADVTPRNVSISDTSITGLAPAGITFPAGATVYSVAGGSGGNTFTVSTTPVSATFYGPDTLSSGNGNDTITVLATHVNGGTGPLIVNAGDGNDLITLGNGTLSNFAGAVTVNGGNGNDTVKLDDSTLNAADTYALTSTTVTRPGFAGLTYGTLETLALLAESGNNTINIGSTAAGTPVSLNAGGGTDTINVNQTDPTAPVTILSSVGSDAVNIDTPGTGSATAIFSGTQQIGLLKIGNGGKGIVPLGPKAVLTAAGLTTTGNAVLDLTTNDLLVPLGNFAGLKAQLKSGFNLAGGFWNGANGIVSSSAAANPTHLTTLGLLLNNDGSGQRIYGSGAAYGLFDSQNPALNDVLIKYTYFGDADLSGHVDGTDYSKLDNGFNTHLTDWFNGDFNYDGVVDGSDYSLIDNAFNTQGASLGNSALSSAAPATDTAAGSTSASAVATTAPSVLVMNTMPVASPASSTGSTDDRRKHLVIKDIESL